MSVILIDDKKVTNYISLGIMEILNNSELAKQFCEIIQNRLLYGHSLDTARYAVQIGLVFDKTMDLVELAKAGLLHDLGKIDIPVEILNKPGKLNDYEFSIMQTHPRKGYDRLIQLEVEEQVCDAALHHHEKLSGSGYPEGTTDITLQTQIITVSDIFSALTELRSYKKPMSSNEAFKIMREEMSGLNQALIDILESRVLDEVEDFRARQIAAYIRSGKWKTKSVDLVYTLGDRVVFEATRKGVMFYGEKLCGN